MINMIRRWREENRRFKRMADEDFKAKRARVQQEQEETQRKFQQETQALTTRKIVAETRLVRHGHCFRPMETFYGLTAESIVGAYEKAADELDARFGAS